VELFIDSGGAVTEVSSLAPSISWSGDLRQCGRSLSFSLLSSPTDKEIPVVEIEMGAPVQFQMDGKTLFDGFVFARQIDTESSKMDIRCFDRGIYVKRNELSRSFSNALPEDIAVRLCGEFGISIGSIAKTGIPISRNFVGVSLYQIIQTAYTLASRETGEAYQMRFNGVALDIVAKAVTEETLVIQGGSNLISASVSESIERMVTQVAIYGENDALVDTVKDDERIRLYGLMQKHIKQGKDKDPRQEARKILDDFGVERKMTVNNLGGLECITGNCVVVEEPYSGLHGLFWIDSDTHTWKNGLYFNKLSLNYRRLMDEQEAGSLPRAKAARGSGRGAGSQERYEYIFKDG